VSLKRLHRFECVIYRWERVLHYLFRGEFILRAMASAHHFESSAFCWIMNGSEWYWFPVIQDGGSRHHDLCSFARYVFFTRILKLSLMFLMVARMVKKWKWLLENKMMAAAIIDILATSFPMLEICFTLTSQLSYQYRSYGFDLAVTKYYVA